MRKGRTLTGESLDFGYVSAYQESWPVFERLREEFHRPDLVFQVGIPGDFDMALFALGLTGPFRHRRPFTETTVRPIEQIYASAGDEVLFQIEVPAESVFVTQVPTAVQPVMAAWMGGVVANLARRVPPRSMLRAASVPGRSRASCGLARRGADAATRVMRQSAELCRAA